MKPSIPSVLLLGASLLLGACESPDTSALSDDLSQGTLVSNTNASGGSRTAPAIELAGDPEGIVRLGGRQYYLKDRRATLLTGRQRFGNGLYLETNGDVTLESGRRVKLGEGQMVTLGSELREAPPGIELPNSRR